MFEGGSGPAEPSPVADMVHIKSVNGVKKGRIPKGTLAMTKTPEKIVPFEECISLPLNKPLHA